jgi:glycosyltransferase involved in cell wall biosynthesis
MATIGVWHEPIADALPELLCVEPNISYPNGAFAQFRVYNSYAMMNAYQGTEFATNPSNNHWYDAMIPIAFDPQEFPLRTDKEDYLLFVGRLIKGKGVHLARTLAENTGMKLIIAGDGPEVQPDTKFVKHIGVIGADERNKLMAGAKALLYPSHYMEPFGAAQIEAMLCGTPVVSSDFGAFSEYNIHGLTGYRCRTYEQFEFAVRKLDRLHLDPFSIRRHAERFSFRNVAPMYTDYLKSVAVLDKPGGMGWYEPRPDRTSLDSTIFSVC